MSGRKAPAIIISTDMARASAEKGVFGRLLDHGMLVDCMAGDLRWWAKRARLRRFVDPKVGTIVA